MLTKEEYVNEIKKYASLPKTPENALELEKLFVEYHTFCYENNLNFFFPEWGRIKDSSFIIPSEPLLTNIDVNETKQAVLHLQEVLQNGGGISEEEAEILLMWSIQKARETLNEELGDITNYSLDGLCGYGQVLTLTPFIEVGAKTTINNAGFFPLAKFRHAFGTVILPIDINGKVEQRRYLLDATYRQFFSVALCNEGRFLSGGKNNPDMSGPSAGYYIIKYFGGKEFASELLTKGYIELKPGILKLYGNGFSAESLSKSNVKNLAEILKIPESAYYQSLELQEELDYNLEELTQIKKKVNFPTEQLNL